MINLCCVYSKQLVEMRRLDVKFDLSLADLILVRHPKSEATFAHRLETLSVSFCLCLFFCFIFSD